MNTKRLVTLGIALVLLALVASACAPAKADSPLPTSAPLSCPTLQPPSCPTAPAAQVPTNPTLSFDIAIHQCSYSGPKTLAYEGFTIDIVAGRIPEGYEIGYAVATLVGGKTIEDLLPILSVEPPNWVNVLGHGGPFLQNMSFVYDLSTMGNYSRGESIFLVCFSGPAGQPIKIGTIGPFEVRE